MPEIDHQNTDEIVCPHCGYIHGDSCHRDRDSGEDDCQECEMPFFWERQITVDYSTSKKKVEP